MAGPPPEPPVAADLYIGKTVSIRWDEGSADLVDATVVSVGDQQVWVSTQEKEVRVTKDLIYQHDSQRKKTKLMPTESEKDLKVTMDTDENDNTAFYDINKMNVAAAIVADHLKNTTKIYNELKDLYSASKLELDKMKVSSSEKNNMILELKENYSKSLIAVRALQTKILDINAHNNKRIATLQNIIKEQQDELKQKDSEIMNLKQNIEELKAEKENMERLYKGEIDTLKTELREVRAEVALLRSTENLQVSVS